MTAPDELIHQSLRLRIMASLYSQRDAEPLEFTHLKALLDATDGNLGSHLATLEKASYLKVEKDFKGKRPRTRISITSAGARAFRDHTAYLREVLNSAG
jgi:DNA-binding MarR family transcriptional regulator